MGRTVRVFATRAPVWETVEGWARENGYQAIVGGGGGDRRLYQRGTGKGVSPMFLQVDYRKSQVRLEAWVAATKFQRMMMLFLIPEEIELDSSKSGLTVPRGIARKAVNQLLERLGQPRIP